MSRGFVIWFTGLSGSGKSTLTAMLASELRRRGVHVETLDGDEVRKHLSKGLGFSRDDRDANIRRIGFVAKLVARSGGCAIAAAISPYRELREEIRRDVDRFCEVYTECPLSVLSERDPKGLYKKALAGEIKNFTGVDDPYQAPETPDVHLHTDAQTPQQSVEHILERLEELGYIGEAATSVRPHAADRWHGLPAPHGGELVDRVRRGDLVDSLHRLTEGVPSVMLSAEGMMDLAAIQSGLYSPLAGFVTSRDHQRILDAMRLETGAPWALPVTLDAPESRFDELRAASRIALRHADGRLLGLLSVQDVWRADREKEALALFGTTAASHPGVTRLARRGGVYVGGHVECLAPSEASAPSRLLDPQAIREAITSESRRALVFRGDRPPTLADEHAMRIALEAGDSVVCAVGWDPDDRVPAAVRVQCFETLSEEEFKPGLVSLGTFPRPAHVNPARLALHASIIAKNLGCAGLLSLRDAGAETERVPHASELGVTLVPLGPIIWSARLGRAVSERAAPPEADAGRGDLDAHRPEIARLLDAAGVPHD